MADEEVPAAATAEEAPAAAVEQFAAYDDAAIASKTRWDAGDTDGAAEALRQARALVLGKATVEQLGDGHLQLVPLPAEEATGG